MSDTLPVPFDFNGQMVRVIRGLADPVWVATDLARVLGYRDAEKMTRMLDDDQKGTHSVGTLGGEQTVIVVNESGLWDCVLRSKRPEAKTFRRWLTGEVLPTLRRDGFYTFGGTPKIEARRAAAKKSLPVLLVSLRQESSGEVRKVLHGLISDDCRILGIEPPRLDLIAPPGIDIEAATAPLWILLDAMTAKGLRWNWHRRANRYWAISLVHLEEQAIALGMAMRNTDALRQALRLLPAFVGIKTVNPRDEKNLHCWVFDAAQMLRQSQTT